jgi:predicted PhzF superfamily epimerase YddE/YHI9
MRLKYFQVSAFASGLGSGNPAGVCPLDSWLPDQALRNIAAENNLSETAFFVAQPEGFQLRWFTPEVEIDLCGHATLAAGHVLFAELGFASEKIRFSTRSGDLSVVRVGDLLELDFPSRPPLPCSAPDALCRALGATPRETFKSRDYLVVFDQPEQVAALRPDFPALKELDALGIIATAPGGAGDFVSRFFAPAAGVNEDPVTGSAHCTLIPFWAGRLGKSRLVARQISARGGELFCELRGDRVGIAGRCFTYLRGELEVPL